MANRKLPHWTGPAVLAGVVTVALVLFLTGWLASNSIRNRVLVPRADERPYDVEVVRTPTGSIVVAETEDALRGGVWGFETETTYTQFTGLLSRSETESEWATVDYVGEPRPGGHGRFDVDAFPEDPGTAFGLGFEDRGAPGELGPLPAWLIDGRRSTWVIIVHGAGTDRHTQALRMIPELVEAGYPVLVVGYRNDEGAPADPSGLRLWGIREWRDLDAAAVLAEREGAQDYFLYAHDFGAEIVSMFLHESDRVGKVRGVVFDSGIYDLEGTLDYGKGSFGRLVGEMGQQVARIRFGLEWSELDQIARADQFDVPILALHGVRDETAPIEFAEGFAAARPDLVRFERFEQGSHGALWNGDRARYERSVISFMESLADAEE
ncbi:MAG: hypothetical protein ABFS21_05060 [Actinomycetota bacterium]